MKSTFLNFYASVLLLLLIGFGCNPAPSDPGISIYKTRGDYYELVTIGMKRNKIFRSSYTSEYYKFYYTGNDTVYKNRARLINGYVLDRESSSEYDVFLSLTFKEYMKKETQYGCLPDDSLYKYVIDKKPYIEYYRSNISESFSISDTAAINELIRKGELLKHFYREK